MNELVKLNQGVGLISSRRIAEAAEKRHDHVLRDIKELIDRKAIDFMIDYNPNLGAIIHEPICIEGEYIASNGKKNPEFLLNEFAANVLAASYDPVIARRLLKMIHQLKETVERIIEDTPEQLMARAVLAAHETINNQKKQIELAQKQLQHQAPIVQYAQEVLKSTSGHTATVIASELNMSAIILNRLLVKANFIRKTGKKGEYSLCASYQGRGYVNTQTHKYEAPDHIGSRIEITYTEAGRMKIHEIARRAIEASVIIEKRGRFFINNSWKPKTQEAA